MQPIKILCGIQALLTLSVLYKNCSVWAELTFVAVELTQEPGPRQIDENLDPHRCKIK